MKRFLLNPEVRDLWGNGDERQLLSAYEQVWNRKRILREIYQSWYEWIFDQLAPGNIMEVGAGTGNFKRWLQAHNRSCWTLDILRGAHVDIQADALWLPFRAASVDNIVMVDALHHFARPFAYLEQVARVLRAGGRLLLVEPFVSVWGWFVYKFLHHERVDFGFREADSAKAAWDGNAAIPQLVLASIGSTLAEGGHERLPLRVLRMRYGECLAYPLSGGFSYRALLPERVLVGLHRLEQARLLQNRVVSLRVLAALEKPA